LVIHFLTLLEKPEQTKFIGRTKELEKLQYIVGEHERTRDKIVIATNESPSASSSSAANPNPNPNPNVSPSVSPQSSSANVTATHSSNSATPMTRVHAMSVLLEGEAGSGKTSLMNELIYRNSFSYLRGMQGAIASLLPLLIIIVFLLILLLLFVRCS
jgi:hypothetical protein